MFLRLICVFSLWFCLVVKFTLLFKIYQFRKFDPSKSSSLKFNDLVSPLEGFHFGPQNFVKFYLFFILDYAKNFICLTSVVKKFKFWRPRFEGNPLVLVSLNFGQILSFFIFFTLNISCFQIKRLTNLNFGRPVWGRLLFLNPHFFVRFCLFLVSTYSETLIYLPLKA